MHTYVRLSLFVTRIITVLVCAPSCSLCLAAIFLSVLRSMEGFQGFPAAPSTLLLFPYILCLLCPHKQGHLTNQPCNKFDGRWNDGDKKHLQGAICLQAHQARCHQ